MSIFENIFKLESKKTVQDRVSKNTRRIVFIDTAEINIAFSLSIYTEP